MSKKNPLEAKIVKHAHRKRFQEYLRAKGRDKATIGYVYWSMFLRSGKGNRFELEESLFLADLGISQKSLRPARKTLVDDGWLSKEPQQMDALTGKWKPTIWTVNTEAVATPKNCGTATASTDGASSVDASTDDRSGGDTVALHHLDANASTCPVSPSGNTSSVEKESKEEKPLAPLANDAESERDFPEVSCQQNQELPEGFPHPMVWEIARIWLKRTNHGLTLDDRLKAHHLVMTYGSQVVLAVLHNTINVRPRSAKFRWNKFSIFADNWQLNHELYLADIPRQNGDRKNPSAGYITAVEKFVLPDKLDPAEIESLQNWFKAYGKVGEWTIHKSERDALGATDRDVVGVMRYIVHEGIAVSKDKFVDLLLECLGKKANGASAGGFDIKDAE